MKNKIHLDEFTNMTKFGIVLLDFGLCKPADSLNSITVVGNARFRAPEAEDNKIKSDKLDVFSLGAMIIDIFDPEKKQMYPGNYSDMCENLRIKRKIKFLVEEKKEFKILEKMF